MGTLVDALPGDWWQFYSLNQIEILVPRHGQPQKPGEISDPTNRIRIIDTGGTTEFEKHKRKVLSKIEFMVNSGSCNEAFKRAGLPTPFDLVNGGKVTLSSTLALQDSSYNGVLGIPDQVRKDTRDKRGPARTLRNNTTGNAIIFLGPDAFDPSYLDEAVPHEFIHVGGVGTTYSWFGWLFGHDLTGFDAKKYADIMANCKDH